MAFHNRNQVMEEESPQLEVDVPDGRLNIFSKVALDDTVKAIVGASEFAQFDMPLVNKSMAKDRIELIERLLGRNASQANPMTLEIIKDMSMATDYPPSVEGVLLPSEEVVAIANDLCDYVTSLKKNAQDEGL
jgi:hypothetical protein